MMVSVLELLLFLISSGGIHLIHGDAIDAEDTLVQIEVSAEGTLADYADIITPQKPPKPTPHPAAMGIVIKNPRPYPVRYYCWSSTEWVYQGQIGSKSVTATNCYVGHVFFFTATDRATMEELEFFRIHIVANVNHYILPPEDGMEDDPYYLEAMEELRFVTEYRERHGIPWLAHYPRDPPIHHLWPTDFIGQKHSVSTKATQWTCIPQGDPRSAAAEEQCHSSSVEGEETEFVLEVISKEPRVFLLRNVLSAAECDLIVQLSRPKMKRSRAGLDGGLEMSTRTSSNAWLGRSEHPILDTIYRRAADILNVSESLLNPGKRGNIVEELQVVWYEVGEEYTPHHDFGANGRPEQRMVTLLFYLTDQMDADSGGETNFPKADGGRGLAVHPGKGSSIMFYSLMPDGNADDKSLHAALPVKKGEKWLANFWAWDPKRY